MAKLGEMMVIKDIDRPDENFKLLIEEQVIGNKRYMISNSYAPALDNIESRVSVSIIDDNKIKDYQKVYGISLTDNYKIRSYYLACDKESSAHESYYTDNELEYYDEIMKEFNKLISSGKCDFTKKALDILKNISNAKSMNSGGKSGL